MFEGLLKYFPDALFEVARHSKIANDKHNPGEPLHWSKEKSKDHADCIIRHLADIASGMTYDEENQSSPTVAIAWRALAMLQMEIENAQAVDRVIAGFDHAFPHNCMCDDDFEQRLKEEAASFLRSQN